MQRYRNGRYAKQRMTATDRLIVLGLAAFTISCGWYIDSNSIDIAQASNKTEIAPIIDSQIVEKGQVTVLGEVPAPIIYLAATPEPKPEPSDKQEIYLYIIEKFGDDGANAITMIRKCENSTFDQTRTNHNRNGTIDYGIFQVNSIHAARYGSEFMTDWKANVDTAYEIYKAAGKKFTPWTCSYEIGQKNYLSK